MQVGVLAIQGDFQKHIDALQTCQEAIFAREIRTPEDLAKVERVILPGGESTTVGLLMQRYGLGEALKGAAGEGMPIWGTCMGMILMSSRVSGRSQYTLDLLSIEVTRNAFGAQVHSFEDEVEVVGLSEPVLGVFIRAPIVSQIDGPAEPFAYYKEKVVGVRQGNRLGTSFHPELTDDRQLHEFFLKL